MGDEGVADGAAGAGDDLERARGKASFGGDLAEGEGCAGRDAGGLQHDGVSSGESGRDFPAGDGEREVPGNDGRDGAKGLAQGEVEAAA